MSTLSDLSEQIYDSELGFEDGEAARTKEIALIESWLDAHVGELNTMLNTSFESVAGEVESLKGEEEAILREMYMYNYYRKHSRNVLRLVDGSVSELDFQTIREGDSVITRSNKSEVAKNYRMLMRETQGRLDNLVHVYNLYASKPSQVTGDDAPE